MIFASSLPGFKSFLGKTATACADFTCCLLFVASCLLPAARRSVATAARAVRSDCRHAGRLLHFLSGSASPASLLAAAQQRLLHQARERAGRLHLLLLDSTQHGQQGALCENTFARGNTKPRPRQSARRQQAVHRRSCHTFVFALLLTPGGLRLPYWLPFYTEAYCREHGRQHRSQADLAAQLVADLPLGPSVPVVVVGDTAFDAAQVRRACARRQYRWIFPVNPERRLAGAKPRPKVLSLSQHLSAADFPKTSFRPDQGELAPLARVSPSRSRSGNYQRTYWVHRRTAPVLSVGEVVLLFSNQKDPATAKGVGAQKVLMSNALEATTEELLRWYGLRWQVELFFKEMKSHLGMCQYKTRWFARVVNWVNLAVLAFCYLEWRRWRRLQQGPAQERAYWRAARTHGLRARLRQEVEQADLEELLRLANSPRGKKRLTELLNAGYDDPAATGRRQGPK